MDKSDLLDMLAWLHMSFSVLTKDFPQLATSSRFESIRKTLGVIIDDLLEKEVQMMTPDEVRAFNAQVKSLRDGGM